MDKYLLISLCFFHWGILAITEAQGIRREQETFWLINSILALSYLICKKEKQQCNHFLHRLDDVYDLMDQIDEVKNEMQTVRQVVFVQFYWRQ